MKQNSNIIEESADGQNYISTASQIREFKSLADDGIITIEEFELKKKQLLGL